MPIAEIIFNQVPHDPWANWVQTGGLLFTALTAIAAWYSAAAARATVREAEATRKMREKPWITIEPAFYSARMEFPRQDSIAINPQVISENKTGPVFHLHNVGDGPALKLIITFQINDNSEQYNIPQMFARVGDSDNLIGIRDTPDGRVLTFTRGKQGTSGICLRTTVRIALPLIRPGQGKYVRMPDEIMGHIAVRGMQLAANDAASENLAREMQLTVTVAYQGKEHPDLEEQACVVVTPQCSRVRSMDNEVLYISMSGGFRHQGDAQADAS